MGIKVKPRQHVQGTSPEVFEYENGPEKAPQASFDAFNAVLGPLRDNPATGPVLERHSGLVDDLRREMGAFDTASYRIDTEVQPLNPGEAHRRRVQLAEEMDARIDGWQEAAEKRFAGHAEKARRNLEDTVVETPRAPEIRRMFETMDPIQVAVALPQCDDETFAAVYRAPKRPRVDAKTRAVKVEGIVPDDVLQQELARRRPVEHLTVQHVENQRATLQALAPWARKVIGGRLDKRGAATLKQQYAIRGQRTTG